MSTYELLSMGLSGFALLISVIGIILSFQARSKSNSTQMGSLESQLRTAISSARSRVQNISTMVIPLATKTNRSEEEDASLEALKKVFESAHEDLINNFEEACAKYLDDKIDRERFKKSYNREIRQLVEAPENSERFNATTSPFRAILRVYGKWNNLETQ